MYRGVKATIVRPVKGLNAVLYHLGMWEQQSE